MKFHEIDPSWFANVLTNRYGLPLRPASRLVSTGVLNLVPDGIDEHESFRITVEPISHRMIAVFEPGHFSGDLIREMGQTSENNKSVFADCVNDILEKHGQVLLKVNDSSVDAGKFETWPSIWMQAYLKITSCRIEENEGIAFSDQSDQYAFEWAGHLISLVYPLLPLEVEEVDDDLSFVMGDEEGARHEYTGTGYERSRINRAACIASHGARCMVCGIDMGQLYGLLGDGFIHVHHIVPISQLGGAYKINPVKDLVPLCPNCHSIAHRRFPPYSIDDLKNALSGGRNKE